MALKNGAAAHRPENKILGAERAQEMVEARRAGKPYHEIAADHGISKSQAFRVVVGAMREARDLMLGEAELYRVEAIDRLTALLGACWDRAMAGSDKHLGEARRIINDLADYTGAKLPVVVEIGESDVDRALRQLDRLLDERARAAEGQVSRGQIEAG